MVISQNAQRLIRGSGFSRDFALIVATEVASHTRCQDVVDREHLQQLLEAMVALLYNRHRHRELATTPEKRLAARLSPRQVSLDVLRRAFFLETTAKAHPKTGEACLPNGGVARARPLRRTTPPR